MRTELRCARLASSKYLSSSAIASSTVFPRRLISVLTERLAHFNLAFASGAGCFLKISGLLVDDLRSEIFTCERRIPICTVRFPLLSGMREAVPLMFILRTLTDSPNLKSDGLYSFFGFAGSLIIPLLVDSIFLSETFSLLLHFRGGNICFAEFVEVTHCLISSFLCLCKNGMGFFRWLL